ncbi:MAG: methyl-accepting chemotaxis sensory transducer [Actinomycetia bacterium]|nr:methyl-accepting chemotaxis sensory transducer [Actinomycetes bacterium]
MRLSIRNKLFGGFLLAVGLTIALGIFALTQMGAINNHTTYLGKNTLPSTDTIYQVQAALKELRLDQLQRAVAPTKQQLNAYQARMDKDVATLDGTLAKYGRLVFDTTNRGYFLKAKQRLAVYQRQSAPFLPLSDAFKTKEAVVVLNGAAESTYAALVDDTNAWVAYNAKLADQTLKSASSSYSSSRTLVVAILIVAAVMALAVAFFVTRGIVNAVKAMVAAAELIGSGDLTVEVTATSNDELGDMAHAFQKMVENLRSLVSKVSGVAEGLGAASQQMATSSEEAGRAVGEIANAVGDVAGGAERQVKMVESARRSAEEVGQAVQESATSAEETAGVASEARSAAIEGVAAAERASGAMKAVRESSTAVTAAMRGLAVKSEEIGGIVETITGIASQTNLLALNAAIEAARAGEQGRGFAVVAEEVRKLAEDSQQAAASIANLIAEIQAETSSTVEIVEDGGRRSEEGVAIVEETRDAFERIGASVEGVTNRVEQIAGAAQQIAASTTKMQADMGEVAAVAEQSSASTQQVSASTEQTSASTQEIAASAQELARTAEELTRLVGTFKVAA